MGQFYYSFAYNAPISLPPLSIQYADFALWQNDWLQGPFLEQQLAYWKKTLDGIPDQLLLPTDYPRPAVQTFRGAMHFFEIPPHLTSALKALCKREGVTHFMALLAVLQLLLARYSGQRDIVVGSPTANRTAPDLEPLIGCFINMLVLRTDLSGNPTFQSLLQRVRQVALGAYAHQDIPFERLVEELHPEREMNRTPLFQVMLAFQNVPFSRTTFADLTLSPLSGAVSDTAKFDLWVSLNETPQGISGTVEYSRDLFEVETIQHLVENWYVLLEAIVAEPEQRVNTYAILTEEERALQASWNATRQDWGLAHPCLSCLLAQQARRTPQAIALLSDTHSLTYQHLQERAAQLAHHLRQWHVGPETCVALCLPRSEALLIAVLAILATGAAYLPLDPQAPPARLAFQLAHANTRTITNWLDALPRGETRPKRRPQLSAFGWL